MAGKRQRGNGSWEFRFQKKGVLPTSVYFTFDTLEEGLAYEAVAEDLLSRGVVPPEMGEVALSTLQHLFDAYELSGTSMKSDKEMFRIVGDMIGQTNLTSVNYDWVERWVGELSKKLAPSTMKKRVEFLGRALAWAMRKNKVSLLNNPVRQLPKGYATKDVPKEKLWAGERDRRLENRRIEVGGEWFETEEGAIRKVLVKKEDTLFFDMALETAMRMRELFTLTVDQIDLPRRTIFLDKTKNGSKRQVPMSSVVVKIIPQLIEGKQSDDLLFSYWNGREPLENVSNRLSKRWSYLFKKAGCSNLHWHDLRHEATSRLYERTTLSDLQIASITGHKNLRMLQRYANLRASTLAERLW